MRAPPHHEVEGQLAEGTCKLGDAVSAGHETCSCQLHQWLRVASVAQLGTFQYELDLCSRPACSTNGNFAVHRCGTNGNLAAAGPHKALCTVPAISAGVQDLTFHWNLLQGTFVIAAPIRFPGFRVKRQLSWIVGVPSPSVKSTDSSLHGPNLNSHGR